VTLPPSQDSWYADPLEVDRHLDGEDTPAERAARLGDAAADPALRALLARRSAFLACLSDARAAQPPVSQALLARVAAALEAETAHAPALTPPRLSLRRRPVWAAWVGAAAAVLVAVGAWSGFGRRNEEVTAHPVDVAVRLLSWVPKNAEGVAGCADGAGPTPQSFVLVQDGELEIRACTEEGGPGQGRALLRRPEALPALGFVAVPAPDTAPSSDVGITEVGAGVVVFDVLDHGKRVYLALDAASLRQRHGGEGQTWTCAACHGPARQALPNPHRMVLRQAP
jgi:hypothetical protein